MTDRSSSVIEEDKLYVTRTYIGNYLDYNHTTPDMYGNPDLIWISTTLDSIHGQISAYGKECKFSAGERLYIRRVLTDTGKEEKWVYQVENNASSYLINEYQKHNNVLVSTWFDSRADTTEADYLILNERLAQEMASRSVKSSGNN